MIFRALNIYLGDRQIGILYQYGSMIRFQVEPDYANDPARPTLSLSMQAADPAQDAAFLLDPFQPILNSPGDGRLPPFFQSLLPEGALRDYIVGKRGCPPDDNFDILAACGSDLPGNVRAAPAEHSRELTARLVTQNQDALEESVVEMPIEDAISISGAQLKVALIEEGGRFVSGRRHKDYHIIGKLPTPQYPGLPEVEHLSLDLARAAGVNTCAATLEPLSLLDSDMPYDREGAKYFLAVRRFDRDRPGRLHAEDFAQVLGVDPRAKYTGGTYADVANVMLNVPELGEAAAEELVRRIAVSELVGNFDFHLKNIGLLHYPDRRIELSPAYDIVAYSVYLNGRGHALAFSGGDHSSEAKPRQKPELNPHHLREFVQATGLNEPRLRKEISKVCALAFERWPELIAASKMTPAQKDALVAHILSRPVMATYLAHAKLPSQLFATRAEGAHTVAQQEYSSPEP